MEKLTALLEKISSTLGELEGLLREENYKLSGAQIDPVTLQVVTDNKSRHLATLAHYENQRQSLEQEKGLAAPYLNDRRLMASWENIVRMTAKLSELNQQNGWLLEQHMENARQLQGMLNKTRIGQMVYGANGHSQHGASDRSFNVNV